MPTLQRHLVYLAFLMVAASACASGSAGPAPGGSGGAVLTAEEIAGASVQNAYEAVQKLRPQFLASRGAVSTRASVTPGAEADPRNTRAGVVVYIDGVRAGDARVLHSIPTTSVIEIRYVSGVDATTKYGTGHGGGVLEVKTH